jgi:cytoskeleton protein RodZ
VIPWGSVLAGMVILAAAGLVWFFIQNAGITMDGLTAMVRPSAPAPIVVPVPTPAPAAADEPAAGAVPAAPVVAATEPLTPPVTPLLVEFDDRSWIEIRDATQKVVFVGEYPKGTRQTVEATAPLQVWIGKASGVRLNYGDRVVDLKPHTREEVARLTIE